MRSVFVLFWMATCVLGAILGIDYGQQFSKSVLLAPGMPFEMVLSEEGKRKDLSGLSIRSGGGDDLERVYGSSTGSLCTRFPQSCVLDIKKLLGRSVLDQETRDYLNSHFGVKIISEKSRGNSIKFDLGFANKSYEFTVEEIMAMNLNNIKQRALVELSSNPRAVQAVEDVIIAVPPFASHEQRIAYLDALQLANFSNVLGLVDEGTAVALNYISSRKAEEIGNDKEYHLVYDMGAGSTKATLFSFTPHRSGPVLELHGIGYDESLGGRLLTESIYQIILEKFLIHFGLHHTDVTPKIAARIFEASEKAKIVLSVNAEYHVSLESIYNDKDFRGSISRSEFEEFNADLMARITKPILDALDGVTLSDIKSVILNGGATRVPFVQNHISVLVGDEKISKKVNTDESCVLGTTVMGWKRKAQTEKPSEVKVLDKSYYSHGLRIGDDDADILVFPKLSVINNKTKVDIGNLVDDIEIGVLEDGRLLKSYSFTGLIKKAEKLSCNTKKLTAICSLDQNKIFDIERLNVECVKEKSEGFFKKLLKQDSDEDVESTLENEDAESLNNTDSSNSTVTESKKRKEKPVSVSPPPAKFVHTSPMTRESKKQSFKKLGYLNRKDQIKVQLDSVKNILEAQCYELRSYIDDHQESIVQESGDISSYNEFVSSLIEWLEFESDDATIEDVNEKLKELSDKKSEIHNYVDIAETDLSLQGIKDLYEQGTNVVMKIQSHMLDYGSEISEIRKKFEEENFDFDKENDRMKMKLLSSGEDKMMNLDKSLSEYRTLLTEVGELAELSENKFKKIPRSSLFKTYTDLAKRIAEMVTDVAAIDDSHKERMAAFNAKFDRLLERRKQKEFRDKLKEDKAKAEAIQKETESANPEDSAAASSTAEDSENTSSAQESQQEETTSSATFVHDEL